MSTTRESIGQMMEFFRNHQEYISTMYNYFNNLDHTVHRDHLINALCELNMQCDQLSTALIEVCCNYEALLSEKEQLEEREYILCPESNEDETYHILFS